MLSITEIVNLYKLQGFLIDVQIDIYAGIQVPKMKQLRIVN